MVVFVKSVYVPAGPGSSRALLWLGNMRKWTWALVVVGRLKTLLPIPHRMAFVPPLVHWIGIRIPLRRP